MVEPPLARDRSAVKDDAKLERWFGSDLLRAFLDVGIYSFDLEDLLRASAEVLGKGSVGTSYKAVLEEGTTVVVKRLKDVVVTKREFEVQMEGLRKVNHENIVPLRAFYYSKDEKLLRHDFMPPGSLSALLHTMFEGEFYCHYNVRGVHTTGHRLTLIVLPRENKREDSLVKKRRERAYLVSADCRADSPPRSRGFGSKRGKIGDDLSKEARHFVGPPPMIRMESTDFIFSFSRNWKRMIMIFAI
ncbi:hypothetical protein Syun_021628 [Stephania yunnanensis]|uniref:Protein kinase domain-containing protein n=1 Tax=Stephania yunnanensis TaxID=152371 RepID=A0AAP0IFZ8_9MAGN